MIEVRRRFLAAGGVGALAMAGWPARLAAAWTAETWTPAERANVAVVQEFLAGWEAADAERLSAQFVADGVARPTAHNRKEPALEGRDAIRAFAAKAFAGGTTVKFKVLDTTAKGPLVMNNRIDRLFRKGGAATDVYYVGVFFLQDGKIVEWIDYSIAPSSPVKPGQPL